MNTQALSSKQGRMYHDQTIEILVMWGFSINEEELVIPDVGVRIDALVTNRNDIAIPLEFKGSFRGTRPGCVRTDTVLKAIGEAYLLSQSQISCYWAPMVVVTSHLPTSGNALAMIRGCDRSVVLKFILDRDVGGLEWLANATESQIRAFMAGHQKQPATGDLFRGTNNQ